MYVLTLEGSIIATAADLEQIWQTTVSTCGHMTLANFTERGYRLEPMDCLFERGDVE